MFDVDGALACDSGQTRPSLKFEVIMSSAHTKLTSRVRSLLERGERISKDDCRDLFELRDIITLAKLARVPHDRRFGRRAYFRGAHIVEYRGEHPDFFVAEADTAAPPDTAELLVRCRWRAGESLTTWKERMARFGASRMRAAAAVSPGFIVRLAAFEGVRSADVLGELSRTLPLLVTAEEAELFDDAFRADHAVGTIAPDEWIGVHRAAHALGMKTIAGMTYSIKDHPAEYADHLDAIRELQDETGGFAGFIPAALHNTGVEEFYLAAPTAAQTLRATAISRIYLDNIHHIMVAPALVTLEVAVVALNFGADVVDTAVTVDDVHSAEHGGALAAALTVIDETAASTGLLAPAAALVRDRIAEARWTPVPLDATFAELVAA